MADARLRSPDEELKMWLVVRADLDQHTIDGKPITAPKLAGQAGHAFERLTSKIYETGEAVLAKYRVYVEHNTPKIVVKCKNLAALDRAEAECIEAGIPCYKVTDAGRTVFVEPTTTVLALGPSYREDLPQFVKKFQLMKDNNV